MRYILIVLIFCCSVFQAKEDDSFSKEFNACMKKSGGVTSDMRDCSAVEWKLQDKKLNDTYKKLLKELSDEKLKTQLKELQRVWIQYRDANCKFLGNVYDGTSALIMVDGCALRMTADRANELVTFMPPK